MSDVKEIQERLKVLRAEAKAARDAEKAERGAKRAKERRERGRAMLLNLIGSKRFPRDAFTDDEREMLEGISGAIVEK